MSFSAALRSATPLSAATSTVLATPRLGDRDRQAGPVGLERTVVGERQRVLGEGRDAHLALDAMGRTDAAHEQRCLQALSARSAKAYSAGSLFGGRFFGRGLFGGAFAASLAASSAALLPRRARSPSCPAWPCSGLLRASRFKRPAASRKRSTRSVGWAPTLSQWVARSVSRIDALVVVLGQHGVVGADLLDEAAVARRAGIGDDDVVVGALLGAGAGKADLESHFDSSFVYRVI